MLPGKHEESPVYKTMTVSFTQLHWCVFIFWAQQLIRSFCYLQPSLILDVYFL